MRKFTLILSLLVAFVTTAIAQTLPATNKSFTITTAKRGGLAANNDATACVGFNHTAVADEAQKNFAFVQYDGNVYLYNVWAKKFMQKDGKLSATLPIDNIQVTNLDGGAYFFKYDETHVVNLGGSSQLTIDSWGSSTWGSTDEGNTFILTEAGDFDATEAISVLDNSYTITYDFQYNGKTVHTQVTKITCGSNYPAFTYVLPYGITANVPEGAPIANETVVITCTLDESVLPFEASTIDGAFGEDVKWYYLTLRSKDVSYDPSTGYALAQNVEEKGVYNLFAFTGNPFDGYSIYNYVAGANKVFWRADATNGGRVSFTNIEETDGNTWILSANGTDGYVFRLNGYDNGYMNDHRPQIAIWNSGWGATDGGSTFTFTYVKDPDLTILYDVTYNYYYGEKLVSTKTVTVENGAAYPAHSYTTPYGVSIVENVPTENVSATVTKNFTLSIDTPVPFEAVESGTPTTWYYTRMHGNSAVTSYIQDNGENNVEWLDKSVAADEIDSHLWGFVGNIFDGYKVVNKGSGNAIKSTGSGAATMASVADATVFIAMTSQNTTEGTFCLRYPNGNYLNAQGEGVYHYGDNDNGSSFFLTKYEETNVTVSSAEWATMYLGYAVYVPENVNVYAVTGAENGYVTKSQLEGVIPANTGVLLENAGTYTFKKAIATEFANVEGNLMKGSVEDTYVEGTAYVLANHTEAGVGFYKAELNMDADGNKVGVETGTHFLNNAGKAYMVLPAASETVAFYGLDWEGTTAIDGVEVENEVKAIYDLTGRRVEAITAPGIYIVNGKKVLVK